MKTLQELLTEVIAEDNSPDAMENFCMAQRRYVEQNMGITDQGALHDFFNQSANLLMDMVAEEDEEDEEDEDQDEAAQAEDEDEDEEESDDDSDSDEDDED